MKTTIDQTTINWLAAASLALTLVLWAGCGRDEPAPSVPNQAAPSAPEQAAFSASDQTAASVSNQPVTAPEPAEPSDAAPADETAAGPDKPITEPMAAEMAAYESARPVFEKYCASCHDPSRSKKRKKALKHFVMDGYPFGGHHAGELGATVRKSLGVGGGKVSMPKDDRGAVKGAELALIVAWSQAYDRAEEAAAGYHGKARAHEHE